MSQEPPIGEFYRFVVDNVISSMQPYCAEEGVDDQVLVDLKQCWESKLQEKLPVKSATEKIPAEKECRTMCIQLPKSVTQPARTVMVDVPLYCVRPENFSKIFTKDVIGAVLELPTEEASVELKKRVGQFVPGQTDGANDSSEEEDDWAETENESSDYGDGKDYESLNSEDDISDDGTGIFDTDNVMVCLYDKIVRVKNKWRLQLRNVLLRANNEETVFKTAVGECEW